jgi:hypothetical protein
VNAALDEAQGKLFGACGLAGAVGGASGISGSAAAQKQIVEANQAIQKAIALAKETPFKGSLRLPSGKSVSQVLANLAAAAQTNRCDPIPARQITAALPELSSTEDSTTTHPTTSTTSSTTTTTTVQGTLRVVLRTPKLNSRYSVGDPITLSGTINEAATGVLSYRALPPVVWAHRAHASVWGDSHSH